MHKRPRVGKALCRIARLPLNRRRRRSRCQSRLCIADFSRSRRLPEGTKPHRLRTKTVVDSAGVALTCRAAMTAGVATPMYAAPEVSFAQLESDCVAGASQDIWSFGAVAFELRVGEPMFFGIGEGSQWRTAVCRLGPPPRGLRLGPPTGLTVAPVEACSRGPQFLTDEVSALGGSLPLGGLRGAGAGDLRLAARGAPLRG